MPKLQGDRLPKHRHHRPSDQGVVTLSGRDFYTGRHGSPESEAKYNRLIAEWLANGRMMPSKSTDLTVGRLARDFASYCSRHYIKRGKPTSYATLAGRIMREIERLYLDVPVSDFGPVNLRTLRRTWTHPGSDSDRTRPVCRRVANQYQGIVLAAFRWAVSQELIPSEILVRLKTVDPLKVGRDGMIDPPPVDPVPDETVEATLPHLGPIPLALVRLQRLTGMRPGEVCRMRPMDLDRSGEIWIYRVSPDVNKSAHHGSDRQVVIGPRAQVVLQPWLNKQPKPHGYIFHPTRGKRAGSTRNQPFLPTTYDILICKACKAAGVPHWNANQLRHTRATEVRAQFGADAAQIVLGHSHVSMTERYAKPDIEAAIRAARESG